ncbi:MAG: cystathionine beta-lyase [Pseudomonadota bacterium]
MKRKTATWLIHRRAGGRIHPTVNPPIERGSTLLLSDAADLYGPGRTYGRHGLSVQAELCDALCELEAAEAVHLAPSGVAACALAIGALVRSGDHVIAQDSLYGPTRRFCERRLSAMGVDTTFVDPRAADGFAASYRDNTKVVVLEAPGSLTFELPDLRGAIDVAQQRGARVVVDNTWSAGVYLKPLKLGASVSVQALTKYAGGHSDAFGGAVLSGDRATAGLVERTSQDWGLTLGPDDAYALLKGLRTLPLRLERHSASAQKIADWLALRSEVDAVLHLSRDDHPDHALWARDFRGASGLFSVILKPVPDAAVIRFCNALNLFGLGFSWGGYESLLIPCDPQLRRRRGDWTNTKTGPLIRFQIGLEDPDDLIADLEKALGRLSD